MNETKDAVVFVTALIKAFDKSLEDGKFSISDIPHFTSVLPHFLGAIKGSTEISQEINTMSVDEIKELGDFISQEFDLRDDGVEALVETMLDTLLAIFAAMREYRRVKVA